MRLWNMKVLNKIKTFAWRACKDILPTTANLTKCRIIAESTCEFCAVEIEDGMHALSCPHVCQVWRDCFLAIDFNQIIQHNFGLFAWDLVEKDPTFDL